MATHRFTVIGHALSIDGSLGEVFFEPWSVDAGTPLHDTLVLNFSATSTKDEIHGSFMVPENYVGSPLIRILWSSAATSGDVVWDFDYNAITDTESMDPGAVDEAVTVTTTVDGTTLDLNTSDLSLTAGNFSAGDIVKFSLARDQSDANDTMANDAVVFDVLFQYADA